MAELVATLSALLSSDNAARNSAEQQYETTKREQPQALVVGLLEVLTVQNCAINAAIREQAAVLLRQCLSNISSPGSVWSRLVFNPSQVEVMDKLLNLLESEHASDKVRRKIADCVQSLANQIISVPDGQRPTNANDWQQLLPTVMRLVTDRTKPSPLRVDSLWLVNKITLTVWPILVANSQQTTEVIKICFVDSAEGVRANTACLFCGLIAHIETKHEQHVFQPLLIDFYNVVMALAKASDAEGADSTNINLLLQELAACVETSSEFFKDSTASHLQPMLCEIANGHRDEASRRLALEVLCSCIEAKPKRFSSMPAYLASVAEVCSRFLQELEDDVASWASCLDCTGESADGEQQHHFGAEVIDRISGVMAKKNCFLPWMAILNHVVSTLFHDGSSWKPTVAGLMLMRQIIEYVEDEETLGLMARASRDQIKSQHTRVRAGAWACIQQLAKDHPDLITGNDWVEQLMPDFLIGLDDPCTRNVISCMSAFQFYGEELTRDQLEPYFPSLMDNFGKKLQSSGIAQREAITCMAVVAVQMQDQFASYYERLMPLLKQILEATVHRVEERQLLGKTFECISLLANAVGKETFRVDAEVILDAMIKATEVKGLPADDPVKEYAMAAAERICSTLKDDFVPYLPKFLPIVLDKLVLDPKEMGLNGVELEDADEDAGIMPVMGEDGVSKLMIISSSELEDLQHAIECIHSIVENLGKSYAPFIESTALSLLPVFECSSALSSELRELTFETWGQLCAGARKAGEGRVLVQLVTQFMQRILPRLETDVWNLCTVKTGSKSGLSIAEGPRCYADGVFACLDSAGPEILSGEQVSGICHMMMRIIDDSFVSTLRDSRRPETNKDYGPDTDDEDDDEEELQLFRQSASNCLAAVMTHHPDVFAVQGLPIILPMVQKLIDPSHRNTDRQIGLNMVSSICEHLGDKAVSHWPVFLSQLLLDSTCNDVEIRQSACYALSFVVQQAAFAPRAAETAAVLAASVRGARGAKYAKKSERQLAQMAADNALSALMEILMHHEAALSPSQGQLWAAWIEGLPCQEDESEGVRNHGMLVQLIQGQKAEVIGANGVHIPKLLAILVDVHKTGMIDDIGNFRIQKLLLTVGETKLEEYATSFSTAQQKKLVRIVREAQRNIKM